MTRIRSSPNRTWSRRARKSSPASARKTSRRRLRVYLYERDFDGDAARGGRGGALNGGQARNAGRRHHQRAEGNRQTSGRRQIAPRQPLGLRINSTREGLAVIGLISVKITPLMWFKFKWR